jgi:hypothetical protein
VLVVQRPDDGLRGTDEIVDPREALPVDGEDAIADGIERCAQLGYGAELSVGRALGIQQAPPGQTRV